MILTRKYLQRTLLVGGLTATWALAGMFSPASAQSLRFQRPAESRQLAKERQVNEGFRSPNSTTQATQPKASARTVPSKRANQKTANTRSTSSTAPRVAEVQVTRPQTSTVKLPLEVAQSIYELRNGAQASREKVRQTQHVPQLAQAEGSEEIPAPVSGSGETEYILEGEEFGGYEYGAPCASCQGGGGGCNCGYGVEPGCGCAGQGCGGGVGCGSCVGAPGPDYWCFPVCLPRFKDLTIWGGVHGFRGPRDFYAPGVSVPGSRSDSNFGFQTGFNLSGRAPLVGLVFPELSYQLGYQAVGSRLSGTVNDTSDRSQQFVTAGFFRQVQSGFQYGLVWDMVNDDLHMEHDIHQIRYELSLKSPQGREIGFWATNSTNTVDILGVGYAAVDQYAAFYRWDFGKSSSGRFWGGFTEDSEGLFGGQFITPINDRWSVESVFNYLIPDEDAGLAGVSQESWNVGINFVWHLGRTARKCARSPYRPLFSVADNGWLFVDRANAAGNGDNDIN